MKINENILKRKSGYTYIQIPESMLSLFNISSQGKSAQNMLEECMYNDTYCIETVSMNIHSYLLSAT